MKETLKRIEALEAEIKKLKDELSEPVFEVGKWYKKRNSKVVIYSQFVENDKVKGYGFDCYGNWGDYLFSYNNGLESATESEVFEALKKEAIKRGFKRGIKINNLNIFPSYTRVNPWLLTEKDFSFYKNTLDFGDCTIFKYGKWAEIISEPLKICGYEVEKEGNDYKIGCKTIHRADVSHLKYLMNSLDVKSAQLGDYKVTLKEINKLLEL